MKTTLTLLTLAAACLPTLAGAALPPDYQRLKEIRAIVGDERIVGAFDRMHPVNRIERIEHDLYRITGGDCSMDVAIDDDPAVRHPTPWGARSFVLVQKPLVCK